jgi:large conductance mechanosensitive channel
MWDEFRRFILRGNVIDLAVGVIIGAAFGAIVTSLTEDVIMPIIGAITGGGLDFSSLYINLSGRDWPSYAAARQAGAAVIGIGAFISTVINFLILALIIFFLVRAVNRLMEAAVKKTEEAPPAPTKEEELLTEIRDILKTQRA